MGILDDIQALDNQFAFEDVDTFSETVTFRPQGGSPRSIKVIVNREVITTPEEDERGIKEVMLVSVSNHATRGISSAVFNAGKDQIDLSYRTGATAKTYTLGMPVSIDAARMLFRVK